MISDRSTTSLSGTLVAYYHLCHRKVWLHSNGVRMEYTSETVAEGKQISDNSYTRRPSRWRELDLDHVKIDHFDPETNTVREVKKSPKLEQAHIAQVKYYLYTLEQRGVENVTGLIEYPKQRRSTKVTLSDQDRKDIPVWEREIQEIVSKPNCPELIKKSYCKTCAFFEFCYS